MLESCSIASENNKTSTISNDDRAHDRVSQPHGRIQKISQEGSKNTYVIILSKDCLKSDSSIGQSLRKIAPDVHRHGHSHAGQFKGQTPNTELHSNREYASPTIESCVKRTNPSTHAEDVKLNLSNINDDEYDSNYSASSVFLKQESSFDEQDSAININRSQSMSRNPRSIHTFKPEMNSCVISSPLQKKPPLEQHSFPVANRSICVSSQYSKIPISGTSSNEQSFSQLLARKIVLLTPDSEKTHKAGSKNTVKYAADAVPILDRSANSSITPATLLLKNNAKAVPMLNHISPINYLYDNAKATSKSAFIPIYNQSDSAFGATSLGPLTSTPVIGESHLRLQQLKEESSHHRPVYIIQSPFLRQCANTAATSTPVAQGLTRPIANQSALLLAARNATSSSMNSSGFISGSSSIETSDASCSFECIGARSDTSPIDLKESYIEIDGSVKGTRDRFGGMVITVEEPDDDKDGGVVGGEIDPLTRSQKFEAIVKAQKAGLNRSLTNIQWLKGMQLKDEKTSIPPTSNSSHQHQNIQWTTLSPEQIRKISSECGREKRPPFSYMSMIQMALYSRDNRKMMLKEICKWIEDTFPYYKYTAKLGWKNSIRHNLSLYNIFEREPAKRHGSYWTVKSDVEPKTKHYRREKHSSSSETHRSLPTLASQIPIIPVYNSLSQLSSTVTPHSCHQSNNCPQLNTASTTASKKKAPPLILPRPTAYSTPQAYALIPLSGVSQPFRPSSPMMRNLTHSGSSCPSPIITEVSAAVASIQMSSASPIPHQYFCDTTNLAQEHIYMKKSNIVKQAWMDCHHSKESLLVDRELINQCEVTTSSSELSSSSEFSGNRVKSKRPRIKPGLPKPKMYKDNQQRPKSGGKKRRLQQTERPLFIDSSEEEDDGTIFISNLQKEIFSGSLKPLGTQDYDKMLTTSTPLKSQNSSTGDLPSPIQGLAPLRDNSVFDDSFLDGKTLGMSPELNDCKKSSFSTSLKVDSSEECLIDFHLLPFPSPDRYSVSPGHNNEQLSNQNLSRILNEYCLDTAEDNPEQFPNLNWSVVQQMVDSMDT